MTDGKLTAGDMCEVTGIGPDALERLVTAGVLTPVGGGRGTGNHRQYGPMDAVAVAYLRACQETGLPAYKDAVAYLASLDFAWFMYQLAEGRRYVLPLPGGQSTIVALVRDEDDEPDEEAAEQLARLDLYNLLTDVLRAVEQVMHRPTRNGSRDPWKYKRPQRA